MMKDVVGAIEKRNGGIEYKGGRPANRGVCLQGMCVSELTLSTHFYTISRSGPMAKQTWLKRRSDDMGDARS